MRDGLVYLALGAGFFFWGAYGLWRGFKYETPGTIRISRSKHPIEFWVTILARGVVDVAALLFMVFVVWAMLR